MLTGETKLHRLVLCYKQRSPASHYKSKGVSLRLTRYYRHSAADDCHSAGYQQSIDCKSRLSSQYYVLLTRILRIPGSKRRSLLRKQLNGVLYKGV